MLHRLPRPPDARPRTAPARCPPAGAGPGADCGLPRPGGAPRRAARRTCATRCARCAVRRSFALMAIADAGARHRREHRDLQRRPCRRAAAAALRGLGPVDSIVGEERQARNPALLGVGAELSVLARAGTNARTSRGGAAAASRCAGTGDPIRVSSAELSPALLPADRRAAKARAPVRHRTRTARWSARRDSSVKRSGAGISAETRQSSASAVAVEWDSLHDRRHHRDRQLSDGSGVFHPAGDKRQRTSPAAITW